MVNRVILDRTGTGVVIKRFFGNSIPYRWQDIHTLVYEKSFRFDHAHYDGRMYYQPYHVFALTFRDGQTGEMIHNEATRYMWDRDFFRYGMDEDHAPSPAPLVVPQVLEAVADAQFPPAREAIDRGEAVRFGVLTASRAALRWERNGESGEESWQRIASIGWQFLYNKSPPHNGEFVALVRFNRHSPNWPAAWMFPAADVSNLTMLGRLFESVPRVPQRWEATGDSEKASGGNWSQRSQRFYLRCPECGQIGTKKITWNYTLDGELDWETGHEAECRQGHAFVATRGHIVPCDAEHVCNDDGCNTLFAIPSDAVEVTCPVCRVVHTRSRG